MQIVKPTLVLGAVFVGLFAGPAHAEGRVEANVPFSFVIRGQAFPAGHYLVQSEGPDVVLLRGADNRTAIYALTSPADDQDPAGSQPALVFTRYENTYQLSEIWTSGSEGRAVGSSSRPRGTKHAAIVAASSDVDAYVVVAGTVVEVTTVGDGL
jgi:hypothetical protein